MDDERTSGGYGSSTGPSGNSNNFGSGFISLGSENPSDSSYKQRWPRGGRGGRPQMISGTGQYRHLQGGGWNRGPGPNHWDSHQQHHQPFHQRRGGSFRGGGFDHHQGSRSQRHQVQGSSAPTQDISAYYHPSMVEDPWEEHEALLRGPQTDEVSRLTQTESPGVMDNENVNSVQESSNSTGSDSFQ